MQRIALLGTGLIGTFYTMSLHGWRSRDRVELVYSRSADRARNFADKWGVPRWTTNLREAISADEIGVVIVALPNHLHEEAVIAAAEAGKAVLCTKPLGRNAGEAIRMLQAVERSGVFAGYLEDLCYTPKTLKSLDAVRSGAIGRVVWVRSREAHSGPHSAWFWDKELSGGGAVIDLGCHCIEIGRNFIGKGVRPVEVLCWGATQVHPIAAEDHALGFVKYDNGAIGQFECSWIFRGGMDLRDEIAGTQGTIWLNHWLRTGFEIFTASDRAGYVAEKAESETGWLFPVGDEVVALGYVDMFADMFQAMESGRAPQETFYDGYIVNAIIDAAYSSMASGRWEPVHLEIWRGEDQGAISAEHSKFDDHHDLIKQERLPDGSIKLILREKQTGRISERIVESQK